METQFSTTFIPKKPVAETPATTVKPVSKPLGILSVIAWIIFVISLLAAAGSYFYKNYLTKQSEELKASVARVEKNFEPTLLNELSRVDKRLTVSDQLLRSHRAISPFFDFLETSTLPTIRYSKIDASFEEDGTPKIILSGEADSYRSIAQQSRMWSQNQYIKNHIFSNFVLTSKGRIAYDLVFYVAPDVFLYGGNKTLSTEVPSSQLLQALPSEGVITEDDESSFKEPVEEDVEADEPIEF